MAGPDIEPRPETLATPADYLRESRKLASAPVDPRCKIALLSSHTLATLLPILEVECARAGHPCAFWLGDFGQIDAALLDPGHALRAFAPDIIAILPDPLQLLGLDAPATPESAGTLSLEWETRCREWLRSALAAGARAVVVANAVPGNRPPLGWADTLEPVAHLDWIARLNASLATACRATPGASVLDLAATAMQWGLNRWTDDRFRFAGRIPWQFGAQVAIARRFARHLNAILKPSAKCLVVDADGILWGGVAGDDGPGGIALGEDFPGNVHKAIQRALLRLKNSGVVLAMASKNDPDTVRGIFEHHPDMVLKWSDFATLEIHWQPKSGSLAAIAERLNLGIDALAFLDDNPAERGEVRANAPGVRVLEVPGDAIGILQALETHPAFDRIRILDDDRTRAASYEAVTAIRAVSETPGSLDAYLESLAMEATVGPVDTDTLPRVAQLLAKTNQFNATTRRHTAPDVERLIQAGAVALWLRLRDRLADHGLTGVAIAVEDRPGAWTVDTFLMSCRILGRRAETVLLGELAARVRDRDGRTLLGLHVPTPRNAVCSRLYADHGFDPAADGEWTLDLAARSIQIPAFFQIVRP